MGSSRGAIAFVIIVLAIISAIGGALFLQPLIGKIRAPKTHQWILDNLEVYDTRYSDTPLEEKLVDYGVRTWGKPLTVLSAFKDNEEYSQTTWIFQRWGDTELCLTIWGPGDDDKSYYVEAAQMGWGPFKIYLADEEKLYLYHKGQNSADPESHNVGYFDILITS
ncbi:MAG: hypothetical protein OEW69_09090 [Nitrospirota bacterium]|nr:hypothetical protein [Nitrospirota bacterium]